MMADDNTPTGHSHLGTNSSADAAASGSTRPFDHPYFDITLTGGRCSVCYDVSDAAHCCGTCGFPRCANAVCATVSQTAHDTNCAWLAFDAAPRLVLDVLAPPPSGTAGFSTSDASLVEARLLAKAVRHMSHAIVPQLFLDTVPPDTARIILERWRKVSFFEDAAVPKSVHAIVMNSLLPTTETRGRGASVAEFTFLAVFCSMFRSPECLTQLMLADLAIASVRHEAFLNSKVPLRTCFLTLPRAPVERCEAYRMGRLNNMSLSALWESELAAPAANVVYLIGLHHTTPAEKHHFYGKPDEKKKTKKAATAADMETASHGLLVRLMKSPASPEPLALVVQARDGHYTLGDWLRTPAGTHVPDAAAERVVQVDAETEAAVLKPARFVGRITGAHEILVLAALIDRLTVTGADVTPADRARMLGELIGLPPWPSKFTLSPFRVTGIRLNLVA